ncbi:hypothetical protein D3C72_1942650 [compost metagenome]
MIGMGVADQHQIEPLHPKFAQRWQHHPFPLVEFTETRSGVIQQRVMPSAYQDRQALSDIQLPDFGHALLQHRPGRKNQHQQHGPP